VKRNRDDIGFGRPLRPRTQRDRRCILWLALALAFAPSIAPAAFADERTEYFIRLLQTSSTFKVRAQAALGLGRLEPRPNALDALHQAVLEDSHQAVRAAAASALGRLGDASSKAPLERAARDPDREVSAAAREALALIGRRDSARDRQVAVRDRERPSSGPARYYVSVTMPSAAGVEISAQLREGLREFFVRQLESLDGVVVAPKGESDRDAQAAIKRRKLTGYGVDTSITRLETSDAGVRAEVSVVLWTHPGRAVKAMLNGGASVPGARGSQAERRALEGAIQSASRRLSQAMESATLAAGR